MSLLITGASVFILISLVLAWLATAVRIMRMPSLQARFPASDNIVKAHIDYILMALLLGLFYLLCGSMEIVLPDWIIWCMLIGGFTNPFAFIVVAMAEPDSFKPGPGFMVITMLSFIITTVGFGGAAIAVLP